MIQELRLHIEELKKIDSHRKVWMFLSAFVVATVIGIIFRWDYVMQSKFVWLVSSLGLTISMVWWYWTMRLVRYIVHYKSTEAIILQELIDEIRFIKTEVMKNNSVHG